ncbi:uncharacterized protein LOC118203294, partial [Stegodyphus dumicola]|uniref:uncharacterized protein LOC118203294 n=1 Tax=Stegodyphus dumicola TaxID=202533 RepID=UPI0015A88FA5
MYGLPNSCNRLRVDFLGQRSTDAAAFKHVFIRVSGRYEYLLCNQLSKSFFFYRKIVGFEGINVCTCGAHEMLPGIAAESGLDPNSLSSSELMDVPALQNFLKELGILDWPNLPSDFQFVNPTIEEFLAILAAHNQPAFLRFTSDQSEEEINSEGKLLNMTVSYFYVLTIPERTVGKFRNMMLGILKYLNVDQSTANRIWQEFLRINDEIRRIAEVDWDDICEDCEDDSMMLDCTGEVEDNLKPICNIVKAVVNYTGIGDQYSSLGAFISDAEYVKSLFPLLNNLTHKAIADYLMLRVIMDNMDDMSFILRLVLQESFEGQAQTPFKYNLNKWKHCVGWISLYMPYALGVEYVSKFLPKRKLKKV